jgi:hypothetical protein
LRGEGPGKDQRPRVLADVDEAPRPGEPRTEARDVHVPRRIGLRETEAGHVEPAPVVEVELRVLRHHRVHVDRRPEVETRGRLPADHARLGRQGDMLQKPLLGRDRGHALGHPDAEIDHPVHRQLEGAAPGDHLARVEAHGRGLARRRTDTVGEGVGEGRAIGLHVQLRRGHDHRVDQNAGDLHLARRQAAPARQPLHLDDDHPARVPHRHGLGEVVEDERLALHRDVAGLVRRGSPQERHRQPRRGVEQDLLAVDLHEPHLCLGRDRVDRAAAVARIHEGLEPHLRQHPGLARRGVAEKLADAALRQVPALDLPLDGQPRHLRDQAPVAAHDAAQEPLVAKPVQAPLAPVPLSGGEDEVEVARVPRLEEPRLHRGEKRLGNADADESRGRQGVPVLDERDRIGGLDDLPSHPRPSPRGSSTESTSLSTSP